MIAKYELLSFLLCEKGPGVNAMITIFGDVKIYNTMSSPVRFEKTIFFYIGTLKKLSNKTQRCSCR
jgi:hypothetical protein